MKMDKRTFLKLCGIAAVAAIMPEIKLLAAKVRSKVLRAARPRAYPGRVKLLKVEKTAKRGDWQG